MTRLECGASETRADRIVAGSVDPEKLRDVWEYEPPKGKVVTEIDLLRASIDREERLRRRADMAILAALLAILAGVAIALVVPSAQADEIEVEWTWKVAPSDKLNGDSLKRIRMAELKDNARQAVETLRDWSAEHAAQPIPDEPSWEQSWEPTYYEPAYHAPSYEMPSGGLNAFTGVNYHDGRTEMYYSSSVLYHYQTPEWTVDSEGFYRTDGGQYVVAASDMPIGTTFQGSNGECVVMDSGCDAGVTDYYVNWN